MTVRNLTYIIFVSLVLWALIIVGGRAALGAEVVAAGDIATSNNGDQKTSDLVLALDPDAVLTMGDNAYPSGTLGQFNGYYDSTWGRFLAKTYPSPGNHEYKTPGAAGYEAYFGLQAGELHSFVLDGWLIVSLDSSENRTQQNSDLAALLASNSGTCELLYFHHPRYSSGEHGNSTMVEPWWDTAEAAGVDLILSGHDHNYERFARRRGIIEFVVGTGGVNTRPFGTIKAGSQKRLTGNSNWGVLDLALTPGAYGWKFRAATGGTGTVRDAGQGACHA